MRATKLQIYKEYISKPKNLKVEDLAKKFGIKKAWLYQIIKQVEEGDLKKINVCTESSRLNCLWVYKYKTQYDAIPKGRSKESITLLKKLILAMKKDKFTKSLIAKLLKKNHTTIIHHLK